jgi:hypothetical protein
VGAVAVASSEADGRPLIGPRPVLYPVAKRIGCFSQSVSQRVSQSVSQSGRGRGRGRGRGNEGRRGEKWEGCVVNEGGGWWRGLKEAMDECWGEL